MSFIRHGQHNTKEYHAWESMKARCDRLSHPQYPNYGGRGIHYEPAWADFENFFNDLGPCPRGLSLERVDNERGYSRDNCKWASRSEQNFNKRANTNRGPGIKGVFFVPKRGVWCAQANRKTLYWGPDFFEACCARKSYDAFQRSRIDE